MKTRNLLALLTLVSIVVFSSCKKDNSMPDPLSKTEAEAAFTAAETDFNDVTNQFEAQTALNILNAFESVEYPSPAKSIDYPKIFTSKDLKHLPSALKSGLDFIGDTNPKVLQNFNTLKGTWTYSTGWSHTTEPTDKVVLIIPFGDGGTATLTFSEYQTKTVGEESYTSHLKAEYKISSHSTPAMTWVYSATRTVTSFSYKFVYTIGEYTKTKTYTNDGLIIKSNPTSGKISWSVVWEKNNSVIHARSYSKNIVFNADQSEDIAINANYRVKDIVVKWRIEYNSISTDRSNPNNYITITVWNVNMAKIADIIFKIPVAKSEYVLYIVFNDGTEVPLSSYIEMLYGILYGYTWYIYGQD